MFTRSPLKEKMRAGRPVLGTWNTLGSPLLTGILARAGLDFQILDLEHGPFILDSIHLHVNAAEAGKCGLIVRVPAPEPWMILQAMDQGAHGILIPHVETEDDTRRLVKALKYHPCGERGFSPFTQAGGFARENASRHVENSNDLSVLGIIIESKSGLDNLHAMLQVEGLDFVYFGAYDLSQALGRPGEVFSDEVQKVIFDNVTRVRASGRYAGGFVPQDRPRTLELLTRGINLITFQVDSGLIEAGYREIQNWFQGEIQS